MAEINPFHFLLDSSETTFPRKLMGPHGRIAARGLCVGVIPAPFRFQAYQGFHPALLLSFFLLLLIRHGLKDCEALGIVELIEAPWVPECLGDAEPTARQHGSVKCVRNKHVLDVCYRS